MMKKGKKNLKIFGSVKSLFSIFERAHMYALGKSEKNKK